MSLESNEYSYIAPTDIAPMAQGLTGAGYELIITTDGIGIQTPALPLSSPIYTPVNGHQSEKRIPDGHPQNGRHKKKTIEYDLEWKKRKEENHMHNREIFPGCLLKQSGRPTK